MAMLYRIDPDDPKIIQWRPNLETSHWGFFKTADSPNDAKRSLESVQAEELKAFAQELAKRSPFSAESIITAIMYLADRLDLSLSEATAMGEAYIWQELAAGRMR